MGRRIEARRPGRLPDLTDRELAALHEHVQDAETRRIAKQRESTGRFVDKTDRHRHVATVRYVTL